MLQSNAMFLQERLQLLVLLCLLQTEKQERSDLNELTTFGSVDIEE